MAFSFSQEKRNQQEPLWSIAFSNETCTEGEVKYQYFATCGGRHATLYEFDGQEFELCQRYASSNSEEDFYAIAFARRKLPSKRGEEKQEQEQTKRILCVGGAGGDILVIDVDAQKIDDTLKGSLSSIFDLKAIACEHKGMKYNLLCSSTQDEVRLWNLDTLANVCIFVGWPDGHFGDVLSVAWHPTGSHIVSGGGEEVKENNPIPEGSRMKAFQICVWNVFDSPRLQEAIQASSYLPHFVKNRSQFNPHTERVAASVHNDVHSYIVDCVDWLGDMVLSKSTHNEIILWKPLIHEDGDYTKSSIMPIKKFGYPNGEVYFVKFATSLNDPDAFHSSFLAVGNKVGEVFLWDLKIKSFGRQSQQAVQILRPIKKTKGNKTDSAIKRALAFGPDGETLVGCDEGGTVFLWKKTKKRCRRSVRTTPLTNPKSSPTDDETINTTSSKSERPTSATNSSTNDEMEVRPQISEKRKSISSDVPSLTFDQTKMATSSTRVSKSIAKPTSSSGVDTSEMSTSKSRVSRSVANSASSPDNNGTESAKSHSRVSKKNPKFPERPFIDLTECTSSKSGKTKSSTRLPEESQLVDLTEATPAPHRKKMKSDANVTASKKVSSASKKTKSVANPTNFSNKTKSVNNATNAKKKKSIDNPTNSKKPKSAIPTTTSLIDLTESKSASKSPDTGIIDLTELDPDAVPIIDLTEKRRSHSEKSRRDAKPAASSTKVGSHHKGKRRRASKEASGSSTSSYLEETKSEAMPAASSSRNTPSRREQTRRMAEEASQSSSTPSASFDHSVTALVEMGFRAGEARQALRDADGDIDRATDWLMLNGSPVEMIKDRKAKSKKR